MPDVKWPMCWCAVNPVTCEKFDYTSKHDCLLI